MEVFQGKLPYDILCFQFFFLVCILLLTYFAKCLKPLEKYWRFNGVNIALFLYDSWLIDSDRDTCTVLATTENIWSDLRVYQGLSPMMRTLNGVRVKFLNGWELYGTSLKGLLLFLRDGKNSIAKSVDIILLSDCLVSARVFCLTPG